MIDGFQYNPQWVPLLAFMPLCNPLSYYTRIGLCDKYHGSGGIGLLKLSLKDIAISALVFFSFSFFRLVDHSGGSNFLCHEQPCGEAHVASNWGLQTTASEKLKPLPAAMWVNFDASPPALIMSSDDSSPAHDPQERPWVRTAS